MAEIMGGKSCVLDVRARMPTGEMVNIEVQIQDQKNFDRRSLFYLSKEYARNLKSGGNYIKLPDVIAINIVNYNFPQTRNFHSIFHLHEDNEPEIILTKALEIHFINMVKYRGHVKELLSKQSSKKPCMNDPLFRWLTWFDKTSSKELLLEVEKMDSTIKTADERMIQVTQSEEDMIAYDRYLIAQCDLISQIDYAVEKGIEKRDQYFLELLDQGLSAEEIKLRLFSKAK